MMSQGKAAQVTDWFARWLTWLGGQAEDLVEEAVDWVVDLGMYGYALGAAVVLFWLLFALWCSSRR